MADSIERRQNTPVVDAQVATPSIIEGPRMYVGGGQWASVEMPPLVEKLSKPQKGEVLEPQSFDGVDTGSYTASWGSQNLAGLFAEAEERTAVDRAAARLALDESARSRRAEAREIRLGRVARKLHKTPEGLAEMLGEAKAVRWASGASKGKVSATRPDAPERRVIEEQRIDSVQIGRMDAWGVEALGPDVQHPAEELTPDQFQHLKIEDQVERMWDAYEAEGRAMDLQVPARQVSEVVRVVPGLDIPKTLTVKDKIAMARNVELGKPKDQDPDRTHRGEWVTTTSKWGRPEEYFKPGFGRPEAVSEGDHVQASSDEEHIIIDHVGLEGLAERERRVEFIGNVKDMIKAGWTRERIQQEIDVYKEIGRFEITTHFMLGGEVMLDWESGREVWFDNGRWGYVDEEFERWHDEALNGRNHVTDGQIEDFYDTETYEGEEEGFSDVDWEDEIVDVPNADGRSESFPVVIDFLAERDDLIAAVGRGEVKIVSAEAYAMQEGIDPDNKERKEQIREALLTAADQDS